MSFSRRKFLRAGTLAVVAAAVPAGVFGQSRKEKDGNPFDQQPTQGDPLANYTRSAFASYLNSIFQLYTGYSVVEVALTEVKDLLPAGSKATNGRESFSLLFRGGSAALPQNTYLMKHPSLGQFQLFLVPGGPDDNGAQSYVAIINRLPFDQLISPPSRTSKSPDKTNSAPSTLPPQTVTPARSQPTTVKPADGSVPPAIAKPPRKRKPSGKEIELD
jgi:hypothetical protein